METFEHFIALFEIEDDDVFMRIFSQSLHGNAKTWFRHLQPESISSWDELREVFLRFWGERKPRDLILSEFYAMRKMNDETISSFSRRFASLYYKMPKEIQPLEGASRLYYASTFPPDLSLLLLERKFVTLQQMFVDALEVEDNLKACRKLSYHDDDDEWRVDRVDRKLELEKQHEPGVVDLNSNPSHCEQNTDHPRDVLGKCHNYVFIEDYDQQVDVTNFVVDGFREASSLPLYDEYEDDYDIDPINQPTVGFFIKK